MWRSRWMAGPAVETIVWSRAARGSESMTPTSARTRSLLVRGARAGAGGALDAGDGCRAGRAMVVGPGARGGRARAPGAGPARALLPKPAPTAIHLPTLARP